MCRSATMTGKWMLPNADLVLISESKLGRFAFNRAKSLNVFNEWTIAYVKMARQFFDRPVISYRQKNGLSSGHKNDALYNGSPR